MLASQISISKTMQSGILDCTLLSQTESIENPNNPTGDRQVLVLDEAGQPSLGIYLFVCIH